jgi:hypothetical protein
MCDAPIQMGEIHICKSERCINEYKYAAATAPNSELDRRGLPPDRLTQSKSPTP